MRPGKVRRECQQDARKRRMLGVKLVLASVEQLHAGGQVLGFVPGVTEHPPGAGGEQTGDQNEKNETCADQAPNG